MLEVQTSAKSKYNVSVDSTGAKKIPAFMAGEENIMRCIY